MFSLIGECDVTSHEECYNTSFILSFEHFNTQIASAGDKVFSPLFLRTPHSRGKYKQSRKQLSSQMTRLSPHASHLLHTKNALIGWNMKSVRGEYANSSHPPPLMLSCLASIYSVPPYVSLVSLSLFSVPPWYQTVHEPEP